MTPSLDILLITGTTAMACALPGVFLILRRMALMSDAISHTVLLGIVAAFFITRDIQSPILILGAALTGILTVSLVELLQRTELVKEDAAIGLVFPALFSIAVILICLYVRFIPGAHLDEDAVLSGNAEISRLDRLTVGGRDLGPTSFYVMLGIFLANLLFIVLFYKELKLATFDPGLAVALGFSPGIVHYGLMSLVSVTVVGAFDAAGSVLVVALVIAPAATAYLLTDRLIFMLALSVAFGLICAVVGSWVAIPIDVSIASAMATTAGLMFGLAWMFAPGYGLLTGVVRRRRQRREFAQTMLVMHLQTHEGLPEAEQENNRAQLHEHLRWHPRKVEQVVVEAIRQGLVVDREGQLFLTDSGKKVSGTFN